MKTESQLTEDLINYINSAIWIDYDLTVNPWGVFVDISDIYDIAIQDSLCNVWSEKDFSEYCTWLKRHLPKDFLDVGNWVKSRMFNERFQRALWDHFQRKPSVIQGLLSLSNLSEEIKYKAFDRGGYEYSLILRDDCQSEILEKIYANREFLEREKVVGNANCPDHIVDKVVSKASKLRQVEKDREKSIPIFGLGKAKGKSSEYYERLFDIDDPWLRSELARNPSVPTDLLRRILDEEQEPWARHQLGKNVSCPLEILEILAQELIDGSAPKFSYFNIPDNPIASKKLLSLLPRECHQAILSHSNCPLELLEEYAGNGTKHVEIMRRKAAQNLCLPDYLAKKIINDPAITVRCALAKNPRLSADVFGLLSLDKHKKVIVALGENETLRSRRRASIKTLPVDQLTKRLTLLYAPKQSVALPSLNGKLVEGIKFAQMIPTCIDADHAKKILRNGSHIQKLALKCIEP